MIRCTCTKRPSQGKLELLYKVHRRLIKPARVPCFPVTLARTRPQRKGHRSTGTDPLWRRSGDVNNEQTRRKLIDVPQHRSPASCFCGPRCTRGPVGPRHGFCFYPNMAGSTFQHECVSIATLGRLPTNHICP